VAGYFPDETITEGRGILKPPTPLHAARKTFPGVSPEGKSKTLGLGAIITASIPMKPLSSETTPDYEPLMRFGAP